MDSDKPTVPDYIHKAAGENIKMWLDVARKVWDWSKEREAEARRLEREKEAAEAAEKAAKDAEDAKAAAGGGGGGDKPPYGSIQQPEDAFIAKTRRLNMLTTKYNRLDGDITLTHVANTRETRRSELMTRQAGIDSDKAMTQMSAIGDLADRAEAQREYEETSPAVKTGRSNFQGAPGDPVAVFKTFAISPKPMRYRTDGGGDAYRGR
jgi:hypothetical protein